VVKRHRNRFIREFNARGTETQRDRRKERPKSTGRVPVHRRPGAEDV